MVYDEECMHTHGVCDGAPHVPSAVMTSTGNPRWPLNARSSA
jgi:hypothetical protein